MTLAGLFLMGMLATVQIPPARTHLGIITGLGGAPEFSESFHDLALQFADAAQEHSRLFVQCDTGLIRYGAGQLR